MTCMTWEHNAQCSGLLLWRLIFKLSSSYPFRISTLCSPANPGHLKELPRFPSLFLPFFPSIVHHIIPLISMVRCINLFASSGVMIWCLGAIDSSLFATSLGMLFLATVLPMFQRSNCPTKATPNVVFQLHPWNGFVPTHGWFPLVLPQPRLL